MVTSSASSTPVQSMEIILTSRSSSSTSQCPCWICRFFHRTSYSCPFRLTAPLQLWLSWYGLSSDKVSDTQPSGKSRCSRFQRKQKIRTHSLSGKSSDFAVVVHLQGLEPWAHWLRETNVQQSSVFKIALIWYFYRFVVNLRFASAASFAPVIPSCIRYPAVPVCKKCAKMCRAKISPLKQVSDFYAMGWKQVCFIRRKPHSISPIYTTHQMYIHNYDSWQGFGQLRSLINPKQLFLCGLFWVEIPRGFTFLFYRQRLHPGYTAVLTSIWQQNPEGSRLVIKRDGFQTKAHKAWTKP